MGSKRRGNKKTQNVAYKWGDSPLHAPRFMSYAPQTVVDEVATALSKSWKNVYSLHADLEQGVTAVYARAFETEPCTERYKYRFPNCMSSRNQITNNCSVRKPPQS